MGLGSILDVSLAKVREKAGFARTAFFEGRDPIAERAATRRSEPTTATFGTFADNRASRTDVGRRRASSAADRADSRDSEGTPSEKREVQPVRVSERSRKKLSNMSMAMLLRRMGRDDISVRGFRSTFRDWAGERHRSRTKL